jgi:hypothetical protein
MGTALLANYKPAITELSVLAKHYQRIEERLRYLKLRYDLFSSPFGDERLFSSLPTRLERIRQLLKAGRAVQDPETNDFEELTTMLKDLETDLTLRELLLAQRSLINYLSRQEEVYASLSRRWKQLTNTMVGIDALVFSDPKLASRRREELEQGVRELEQCLQGTTPESSAPRRLVASNQLSSNLARVS